MNTRTTLSAIIALIILALCYAFYAEFVLHLEPCPLCIVERVILAAIIFPSVIFLIHNPRQKTYTWIYSIIILAISAFGIKVASHHIWLTNLPPDQQPLSCGMPLAVMFQNMPLGSFIHKVLEGDAECAKINWQILGVSAPTAVLILFAIIIILTIYTSLRNDGSKGK